MESISIDRADLELVLSVRRHASLSAAAQELGVAPPAVTKRLAALEARLGHRLFVRTTRRVSATAEGDAVCERAGQLLEGFRALEEDLTERRAEPAGRIRLVSTFGFGRLWLGPALATFQQRHPRVTIQLELAERLPDLAGDGYDGAVWLWSPPISRAAQWVSRRLARNQRVLVAAPAYIALHGAPRTPDDLAMHRCLVVRENDGQDAWSLQRDREKHATRVRVTGPLCSNSGELVRDWCLAGQGIMLRSLWDIAPHLARGELVQVLPAYAMHDADIHWLAPWQPRQPRRLRLLLDHLVERFRSEPWRLNDPPAADARPG